MTPTTTENQIPSKVPQYAWLLVGFGLLAVHLMTYGARWSAPLCLVAYAPILFWLDQYGKRPFVFGLAFGMFHSAFNLVWLGQFVGKWTQSFGVGFFVVIIVGLIWGVIYGTGFWIYKKWFTAYWFAPAILLLGCEYVRTSLPQLEFPFTFIGAPLVNIAHLGFYLGSEWLICAGCILANGVWFALIRSQTRKPWQKIFYVGCAIAMLFFSDANDPLARKARPDQKTLRVGLGQLGFDLAYCDPGIAPFKIKAAVERLIVKARKEKVELLILPEAVAAFARDPITSFEIPPDLKVLFGASRGRSPRYQSAYLWDGATYQHTDKKRLVVFGEYVPFRGIIPYPASFQLPSGDLAPGKERKALTVSPGVTVGPMICFESLFAESASDFKQQNVSFLAIMSLDDWYMGTNAIPRLVMAAKWRAVESGRWVARVGSLGKTCVIDPLGRIRAELPLGPEEVLVYDLPLVN